MAGYITKPVSYAYEGEHVAKVDAENGDILMFDTDNKLKAGASTTAIFTCVEKVSLEGMTTTATTDDLYGYRFIMTKPAADTLYFVENLLDVNTCAEYDAMTYKTAAGDFVRVHPLQVGDEFVTTAIQNAVVGTAYKVTAGKIAA